MLPVTVQCTLDGQFVLVVARDATVPRISLDSISLLGGKSGPCSPVDSNTAFAIYQFPVTACGTNMMVCVEASPFLQDVLFCQDV